MIDAGILDRIEALEKAALNDAARIDDLCQRFERWSFDIERRLEHLENKGQLGYVDSPSGQG